jgi:hypothetical protein
MTKLISHVKLYSDTISIKSALGHNGPMTPYLKIVIEPKKKNGINLDMQGPYLSDLTSKSLAIGNFLNNITWSTYIDKNSDIHKPIGSIKKAFSFAIHDARHNLRSLMYQSNIIEFSSPDKKEVIIKNRNLLNSALYEKITQITENQFRQTAKIGDKINKIRFKMKSYSSEARYEKTARMIKRIFVSKRIQKNTKVTTALEKRATKMKKEIEKLKDRITRIEKENKEKIKYLKDVVYSKSNSCIRDFSYNPSRKDLIVHATILLIGKNL